ncbi:ribosomal protein S18-alanine N-acetyltransferase [Ancylobacter pratisalsi]|uniref:Ribosomal protein S18-alanine N-acetyltransferase n=1 Tax=Ancylobacter pratisalsi TaxID=1745854 RepID=A0A6P1YLA2_9HYPH|nr:ribosomal protein S18-alanine N-acetyltransferase [Ancylobacter pratisalsi]QIB33862.1 ribosomal protein S18-alanine N-acetyltransferase [Ancylobacter pratisalsi]
MSNLFGRLGFGHRDVALRPARTGDAEALARLHAAAFRVGWDSAEFERLIANRLTRTQVATDGPGGKMLGFILLSGVSPEIEILSIAVDRTARGRGIGLRLVETAFGMLAAEGFTTVFLEVEEGNAPAVKLYARTGFREIGRRQGYYRSETGTTVGAITMRRDIA